MPHSLSLLATVVKPEAPFDIRLEENDGGYNISWKTAYEDEDTYLHRHLIYRVRIRTIDQRSEVKKKKTLWGIVVYRLMSHKTQ